jgi:hypothetical protein
MSLIIKGVTADDAGKYKVVAKNELGQDSAEMDLLVKGKCISKHSVLIREETYLMRRKQVIHEYIIVFQQLY